MKKSFLLASVLASFILNPLAAIEKEEFPTVVVLGGGIGALSSALYLSRAGITPLVIEGQFPGGAIAQSHSVQNWPGEVEIAGVDLVEKIHKQVELSGAKFLSEEVVAVDFSSYPFTIITKDLNSPEGGHKLRAQSCIIALGSTPNRLQVPGEKEYWGKGVYSCAVCDGSLFKNKAVAVVGGSDAAITEALYLSKIAEKVYVIVRKDTLRTIEEKRKAELLAKPNVEILYRTVVEEIKGNGNSVTNLVLKKESEAFSLTIDALFLAVGSKPNSALFQNQLALDKNGYILLKKDQETSVPGVFAVGDIVDPTYKQAISAAGDGAKAALQAEKQLSSVPYFSSKEAKTALSLPKENGTVIEIASAEELKKELKDASSYLFVDFYASWCPPCKNLNPQIEEWAKRYEGKIKFLKVNVDKLSDVAQYYNIRSMPTALFFDKTGRLLERKVGQEIYQFIQQFDKNNP